MRAWLAALAAVPIAASAAAQPQLRGMEPLVAHNPPESSSNFKLPELRQFTSDGPLHDGMIAQQELAPNARLGVGLAPMRGRNIRSVRIEQELVPTNNPGVSLVIKFPH